MLPAVHSLLFIEDDDQIRLALKLALEDEGYQVREAPDGTTGLAAFVEREADLVLLDLRLPDMSGFDVCRSLRARSIVPIIMITAQTDTYDLVAGLEAGADDYITKPFGVPELLARLRAAVRRAAAVAPDGTPVVETASFTVDLVAKKVRRDGAEVHLSPTEWGVLEHLARHPGMLVTQQQILREVWGPAYGTEGHYLRVYLAHLRRKLEPDPARPRHLVTEAGRGYRFEP
jgi:two-component system, OmpR family, KDP operon response regulator KdpE